MDLPEDAAATIPAAPIMQEAEAEKSAYKQLLETAPVAKLSGESLSPDGRFEIRTAGRSGQYISGLILPEKLEIVDTETGTVLWSDRGYLLQSAYWSPGHSYLALSYGGRTWENIRIFETERWTCWEFVLPDGGSIPEYTFLPENWGVWETDSELSVTLGRGGDGEPQTTYCCCLRLENGQVQGTVFKKDIA